MRYMKILRSLSVLFMFVASVFASEPTLNTYEEAAAKAIPFKEADYLYVDLQEIYKPILHPVSYERFQVYFDLMFSPEFPKPIHNAKDMVKFYRCLYAALLESFSMKDVTESVDSQISDLYKRLYFHKTLIAKFDKDLAMAIPDFPCQNCIDSAKKEIKGQTMDMNENKEFY